MSAHGEVFLRALGAEAERLHPEIRAQMEMPETRRRADGVFEVAGSRFGRLTALGRPVAGAEAVVSRFERDVPFALTVTSGIDDRGRPVLDTTREFRFRAGAQRITDRLTASTYPGLVRNLLGRAGRLELIERCTVTERGFLRMRTERLALRTSVGRVALPGPLRVDVQVEDGWDEAARRRTITMRATNPLVGTVLEYRGWYRWTDADGGAPESAASQ